jgi:hypothetical protein
MRKSGREKPSHECTCRNLGVPDWLAARGDSNPRFRLTFVSLVVAQTYRGFRAGLTVNSAENRASGGRVDSSCKLTLR